MFHTSALHTDLYQITMAQAYWKLGMHTKRAVFELFYRKPPFGGNYAIACGLQTIIEWIQSYAFTKSDIDFLAEIKGPTGSLLFDKDFLQALLKLRLSLDIHAMEEGTVVFPKEPLIRVTGSLWECQLLETMLLNLINFPTLIATKASRVCKAALGDPVIEFGLRRAQGPDGGLTASRACYVGGAVATSNVLAGKIYGIPLVGTHAHSFIMAFDSEYEAFSTYAEKMPCNSILLVDTYQTIEGVKNAIKVGFELKKKGHSLYGIRLDSGDLAKLSIEARQLLDETGFKETKIVGSSDLDEYAIRSLKERNAKIDLFGVGTRMVTGYEQPALGGVYKLVALQDHNQQWQYRLKESDDPEKRSVPGIHGVYRIQKNNQYIKDIMVDILNEPPEVNSQEGSEALLKPIFKSGQLVYQSPSLENIRRKTLEELGKFSAKVTDLNPEETYPIIMPTLSKGK